MKILAFIPARSGSKGLPGKNIINFAGKPLIAWTILSSLESKLVSNTIVSTDSQEIADVALKYGAEVPFLRPGELARDDSLVSDAIIHCLDFFSNKGEEFDYVVLLQPTQPLRPANFVDEVLEYYFSNKKTKDDMLVTVTEFLEKPDLLMKQDANNYLKFLIDPERNRGNRQNALKYFIPSGLIYIAPVAAYRKCRNFYGKNTMGYETSKEISVDIDTEEDLERAIESYSNMKREK